MAEELEALSVILPRLDGDQVETIFRAGMLDLMGSADDIDEDEVVSMLSAADVDAGKPMMEVMRAAQFLLKEASEFELPEAKVKKNLSPLGFSVAHASAVYKIMGEFKQKKMGEINDTLAARARKWCLQCNSCTTVKSRAQVSTRVPPHVLHTKSR